MAQRSNFRRQPEQRTFAGECPVHGSIDRSEVEQFDGSMTVRPCKQCQFHGLRVAPQGSEDHSQALANLQAESVNSALVGSGITPRFSGSTFATYRTTTTAMTHSSSRLDSPVPMRPTIPCEVMVGWVMVFCSVLVRCDANIGLPLIARQQVCLYFFVVVPIRALFWVVSLTVCIYSFLEVLWQRHKNRQGRQFIKKCTRRSV